MDISQADISLSLFTYQHFLPCKIGVLSINFQLYCISLNCPFSLLPACFFSSAFSPDYVWMCPTKLLSSVLTAWKYLSVYHIASEPPFHQGLCIFFFINQFLQTPYFLLLFPEEFADFGFKRQQREIYLFFSLKKCNNWMKLNTY